MRVSKRKLETFLSLRFQKQKDLYQKKLDIAKEITEEITEKTFTITHLKVILFFLKP